MKIVLVILPTPVVQQPHPETSNPEALNPKTGPRCRASLVHRREVAGLSLLIAFNLLRTGWLGSRNSAQPVGFKASWTLRGLNSGSKKLVFGAVDFEGFVQLTSPRSNDFSE